MLNTDFAPKSELVNGCKLIDINSAIKITAPNWIRNSVSGSLERILAIHKLNRLYQNMPLRLQPVDFCRKSLEVLNVNYAVTEQELAALPKTGPLVIIANHPFGGLEGIILAEILLNIRPDVRISATIQLTIGKPILWQRLEAMASDREVTAFLRFNTYLLKHRKISQLKPVSHRLMQLKNQPKQYPIVAPVHKAYLKAEIDALPEANLLLNQKMFRIYMTTTTRSPAIMREISRLRELSFRDVDEGTGQSLDQDEFDAYYLQLFYGIRKKKRS